MTTTRFGFAREIRRADFATFPRWYGARCLLTPPTGDERMARKG